MAKDTKKTMITLDDVEYTFEDMTPQEQNMVNHIHDLDRKIAGAQFSIDQLQVGKAAFINMLKASLTEPKE